MGIDTDRRPARRVAAAVLTAALATVVVAGCEGGSRSGSDNPGAAVATPTGAAPQKTSVNDASEKDLAATLRDAGVSDAEKWAQTLVQYRPYPAGDAGAARIKEVLDQFKADPDTVSKVTAAVVA
ncbi:MAG: hypothetical protein J0I34_01385 [Pseudonocardia sp.]|uniref:hypothetical protein n=1 Tax=unclassified Pseudonocardia TaxID=2619320 RepID=UPI00086E8FEB|nr:MULTISPECIES: hypothetical protein [unclassified Pseudonocardia]MBN9107409.1 hypothetical protein [Pseudonocardia sp.]ODU26629.1 MAG: hypothetical protein ABS80_06370 [Pseudonocardia sp. SCN 72-51]ODV08281.1 MAG: hypothetical protein ABT15_03110 [Pseudonocardia sp. SCN 73-27]